MSASEDREIADLVSFFAACLRMRLCVGGPLRNVEVSLAHDDRDEHNAEPAKSALIYADDENGQTHAFEFELARPVTGAEFDRAPYLEAFRRAS
jgi:hypothetical protein